MPFCNSACTASHDTEMLVELVFCPFTICGAPSGSDEQDESWSYINKKKGIACLIYAKISLASR